MPTMKELREGYPGVPDEVLSPMAGKPKPTNKVWRLAWSDNAEHGEHFSGYTDYTEFVIVAPDEATARAMAQERAGESVYGLVDGWTNPHWTACELVDTGTVGIVGSCQGTG